MVTESSSMSMAFENAVNVTPISSHEYSAFLQDAWCTGTVPHGGYTAAVIYRLVKTHFAKPHAHRFSFPPTPISMQLSFLRRTAAGLVNLRVEDMKLGARTSTVHVTLLQRSEEGDLQANLVGYVTVSSPTAEVGITAPTNWSLQPPPQPGSGPNGEVNLSALGKTKRDGAWTVFQAPDPAFRRAATKVEIFSPDNKILKEPLQVRSGLKPIDQWVRFRPEGVGYSSWTDEAVAYLIDMFPLNLEQFQIATTLFQERAKDNMAVSNPWKGQSWCPTVTLNVDFKKRLPQGVEWLYSQIHTKAVCDGRQDLEVIVMDEKGEVVAISNQVGLILDSSRNVGTRTRRQEHL